MANLPGGHLSPSQIDGYIKCPCRYCKERIEKRKQPTTLPMIMGTVWGEVIRDSCFKVRIGKPAHTPEQALTCLETKWNRPLLGRGVKKKDVIVPAKIGSLPSELRGFANNWSKFKLDDLEPIDVDEKFGMEVKVELEIAGVPVLGYVDMVERGVVTDFKVANNAYYYDPGKSIQLLFYAVALKIPRVGFMVFEKKTGKKIDKYVDINLTSAKEWLTNLVSHTAHGIRSDVFPPRTDSALCSSKWCPFWDECVGSVAR